MKIHWAPKYPEVFNLGLHSGEGFFMSYVSSKSGEDSCSEHILCHACFCPQNHRRILIMHFCIGCLNDGFVLPPQIVLTSSEV
jgi:hypothetical protein